ncbi:zinc ABC transporter substrate-binding protein [Maritimibacter dapengensis]|uniref:High-affinity zinc uptake system protein ZnuA n=1 Tax=Maritimibacter dapengensis TaxID=2836868 RepID=A0ABS6T459_9RHOB|nr:zinc ABC transporter substrate-binding protein [Maritimibacter dapengensis]MBV7380029.1 zinc ABC transporter substrate-binding protein [Maritimibacter dapengensis]
MTRSLILGTVSVLGLNTAANADVPVVVADIPPVHSLVAKVMDGVGSPVLLVQPGASPHGYSLRPSEAASLDKADVVFWIGEGLEPWLEGPLEALAANAQKVELAEVDGAIELPFREGATFEKHSQDHDEEGHDDHHDDHAEEGHDDHDHSGSDPHAWLDPENARVWLSVIAAELSEHDPGNADTYRANAEAGRAELSALIDRISGELEPFRDTNFIVFHDAYQYFENRFDIPAAGSITLGDATDPGPARIEEVHDKIKELGATCAFAEPQFNRDLVETVFRGADAKIGIMDPLGTELELGPNLYPQLIANLSATFAGCLE